MTEDPKSKKKTKLPRTPGRERDPEERRHDFKEVSLGYTPAMARLEASRCIQCKKPNAFWDARSASGFLSLSNWLPKENFWKQRT